MRLVIFVVLLYKHLTNIRFSRNHLLSLIILIYLSLHSDSSTRFANLNSRKDLLTNAPILHRVRNYPRLAHFSDIPNIHKVIFILPHLFSQQLVEVFILLPLFVPLVSFHLNIYYLYIIKEDLKDGLIAIC